jgi:hypothetical protein
MTNLFLVGILMPLLALAPVAYAQNTGTNFINNETLNQAKNTSIGLLDQAPGALKSAYSEAKNTSIGLLDQAPGALKSAYSEAKNTSIGLLDQAPGALKSAYSEAKNTSIGLVDRVSNLIKNDTNSSKLLNELEGDVGNLINEFSSFFSR